MAKKYQYKYLSSKKSRLIALVLCVMFGFFGLHYFYVNRYWRGALNLFLLVALTIASSIFGIHYFKYHSDRQPAYLSTGARRWQ